MTKLLLPLPILLLLLATAMPALAEGADPPSHFLGHYLGHYRYAGGVDGERNLRRIVDAMVSRFTPLLRGLARRRLDKTVRVPESIEIAAQGGVLQVSVLGSPGFSREATFENGVLVQRNENFEGSRTTLFELGSDGTSLTMRVTTRSALLPDVLAYELEFARDPDAFVGGVRESGSGS